MNSLGLPYDYDSIMHYAKNTFSRGTYLDTILPMEIHGKKRPEIGQRLRLSEGDIAQTNLLYRCYSELIKILVIFAITGNVSGCIYHSIDSNYQYSIFFSFFSILQRPVFLAKKFIIGYELLSKYLICIFTECGRTFQENSGSFGSPILDHPNRSPPVEGERCEWRITATHGERIVLNITSLDIFKSNFCRSDYLEIRDGYWFKSNVLGK